MQSRVKKWGKQPWDTNSQDISKKAGLFEGASVQLQLSDDAIVIR